MDLTTENSKNWEATMMQALEGPYKGLRDDNFVTPNAILVYTEKTNEVTEVDLMDLPLLYPCKGKGARWSTVDLGEVVADKAQLFRQSCIAHEISDVDPEATPTCGTVVLVIPRDPVPYSRVGIKANIVAGQ